MTYPPATLNFLAAKKKWYVYVTVPPELRPAFKGETQVRRSTGTSDKREAQRKLHAIAASIYEAFNQARPDKFTELARELVELMPEPNQGAVEYDIYRFLADSSLADKEDPNSKTFALSALRAASEYDRKEDLYLLPDGSYGVRNSKKKADLLAALQEELKDGSGSVSFNSVANEYLEATSFTRQQVKKQAEFVVKEFSTFLGGKALAEITPVTLYDYAQGLSDEGMAYNTIRGRIDKISLVFHYAVRKGVVAVNPCLGLKLQGYGKQRESYKPLTEDEVAKLFNLEMPTQHRLLFECLTMTGARLDEIALLTWDEVENVKMPDGSEATFFNLTKRPTLRKNKGSLRHVPLHPKIQLPPRGKPDARLFDCFSINADGKTTSASEVMVSHIRRVTADNLKVVYRPSENLLMLQRRR